MGILVFLLFFVMGVLGLVRSWFGESVLMIEKVVWYIVFGFVVVLVIVILLVNIVLSVGDLFVMFFWVYVVFLDCLFC